MASEKLGGEKMIDKFLEGKIKKPIVYTGGVRWATEGLAKSDVCLMAIDPTEENYKALCDAFISQAEEKRKPGILYVPAIDSYAWIPEDKMTLEQRRQQKLPGKEISVSEVSVVDQGGHPNVNGMSNQFPRTDKDGRAIFNPVFDENGKIIEAESYTPRQMRRARVPKKGFWICFNYPEAYEEAFDTPWKRKVIEETTGYTSIDEASWLGMKNVRVLDWKLLKVHPSGKVTEIFTPEAIPFTRGKSCTLLTFGTGVAVVSPNNAAKWTVGARGGDTQIGNAIQIGSEEVKKIPGGEEIYKEIKRIIENAKTPAIQIAIETRLDQGKCVALKEIIEYNYFDPSKMW
jgi:hypothetical protein